jgi:chromosome partitioning protein
MIVITMAGEKGGIGKTTLTFHLACHLAEQGRRVLAVDFDPQGNLTYTLTGTYVEGTKRAVMQEWPLSAVVLPIEEYGGRLDLLGGKKSTGDVRNWLAVSGSHLDALDGFLGRVRAEGYEYVLIDTPPSPALDNDTGKVLDALTAPAFYSSSFVLAPVILETLPLGGLTALSQTLHLLQVQGGARVQFLGVVPMMYDARTSEHSENLARVVQVYEHLVYPVVSRAIAVSRCPAYGQPVWDFEPGNQASEQLRIVAERTVEDVESRA